MAELADAQVLGTCELIACGGSTPPGGTKLIFFFCYTDFMTEEVEQINITHPKKHPSWHILFLLIPSVVFILVLIFFASIFKQNKIEPTPTSTPTPTFQITINGINIEVEIANTNLLRQKGLSNRDSLDEGKGMFFVFETQNIRPTFWMKDMQFPIDIIWINNNQVSQIMKNVRPDLPGVSDASRTIYKPNDEIDFVLEVPANYSDKVGIKEGDLVALPESYSI